MKPRTWVSVFDNIRIAVLWRNGKWQQLDGDELPKLREGTSADLVMPTHALTDDSEIKYWTQKSMEPFLAKSTTLFVRVNRKNVPPHLEAKTCEKNHQTIADSRFVGIKLDDDLNIILRPGKKGKLIDCPVSIKVIGQSASSINEAYRIIATKFEPERRSNSGNIFRLVFVEQKRGLVMLDRLREELTIRLGRSSNSK